MIRMQGGRVVYKKEGIVEASQLEIGAHEVTNCSQTPVLWGWSIWIDHSNDKWAFTSMSDHSESGLFHSSFEVGRL